MPFPILNRVMSSGLDDIAVPVEKVPVNVFVAATRKLSGGLSHAENGLLNSSLVLSVILYTTPEAEV